MVKVLYREGSFWGQTELETFTRERILDLIEVTEEDLFPNDENDLISFTEKIVGDYKIFAFYNSDGLAMNWIGPK